MTTKTIRAAIRSDEARAITMATSTATSAHVAPPMKTRGAVATVPPSRTVEMKTALQKMVLALAPIRSLDVGRYGSEEGVGDKCHHGDHDDRGRDHDAEAAARITLGLPVDEGDDHE